MKARVMYVELKVVGDDTGAARIGRVSFSKTGRTIYYAGKTLRRAAGISGNYVDVDTGDEYWVSGCKKDGQDRHRFARQREPVEIDEDVRDEYWTEIRGQPERRRHATSNR
jgi:hypothetical protein